MPQNLPPIRLPRRVLVLAFALLAVLAATGVGTWHALRQPSYRELDCPPLRMPEGSRPLCTASLKASVSPLADGPVSEQGSPARPDPNCEKVADLIESLEAQAKRLNRPPKVLRNLAAAYCIAGRRDKRLDQLARGLERWLEAEAGESQESLSLCEAVGVLCTDRQLAGVEPPLPAPSCEAFGAELEPLLAKAKAERLERILRTHTGASIEAYLCRLTLQAQNSPAAVAKLAAQNRELGTALSRVTGDPVWTEALDHLEALASSPETSRRDDLLKGLSGLTEHPSSRLRDLQEDEQVETAAALGAARDRLRSVQSPLWLQAELAAATAGYFAVRCSNLTAPLQALLARPVAEAHPFLAARARSILGTCSTYALSPAQALEHYQKAKEHFRRQGLEGLEVEMGVSVADAWMLLGQTRTEWYERLSYLQRERSLSRSASTRTLGALSFSAAESGWPHLAALWNRESLRLTKGTVDIRRLDALTEGIEIATRLGRTRDARERSQEAREVLSQIPARDLRATSEQRLLAAEAAMLEPGDPNRALAHYEHALALARRTSQGPHLVPLLSDLAEVNLRLGRVALAEAALAEAVSLLVQEGRGVLSDRPRDTGTWQEYAAQQRPLFDRLVGLQVRMGAIEKSFETAEIGRSRELNALLAQAQGLASDALTPVSLDELRAGLDSNTAYLVFMVLPEKTLAWIVRDKTFQHRALDVSRTELRRHLAYLLQAVEERRHDDIRSKLSSLHETLLEPLKADIAGIHRLIIVPDDALNGLPFAALYDRLTNRYLLQSFTLETSPSAAFHRHARARALALSARRALIVAASDFPKAEFADLSELAGSELEAQEIAGLYPEPDRTLLLGAQATKAEVLSRLADFDVFHFSGHGVAEPLRSYLVLAGKDAAEARLEPAELLALSLRRTELAILAACESLGDPIRGSEGATSLVRPLLGAGVPTVVASLWKVPDQATRSLMSELHDRYRQTADAAEALRRAQLQLLESADPEARQPRSWAGFVVVGAAEPTEVP